LNRHLSENLPFPLFAFASANPPECGKEGYYSSLWKREVRRDFTFHVAIITRLLIYTETRSEE